MDVLKPYTKAEIFWSPSTSFPDLHSIHKRDTPLAGTTCHPIYSHMQVTMNHRNRSSNEEERRASVEMHNISTVGKKLVIELPRNFLPLPQPALSQVLVSVHSHCMGVPSTVPCTGDLCKSDYESSWQTDANVSVRT